MANGIDDEIFRGGYKQQQGRVFDLTDIDGVGPKTAKRIKAATGTRNPQEVAQYSAGQLADMVTGVSRQKASIIIRESGGTPQTKKRGRGGDSLLGSKAPKSTRMFDVGDFSVDIRDQDSAKAKNDFRSQTARRTDRNERAPVTTDLGKWKENKSTYDYPGVDTPTADPGVRPKDFTRGGPFETSEQASETATDRPRGTGAKQIPNGEAERSRLGAMDISLTPEEAFEGAETEHSGDFMGRRPSYAALPESTFQDLASGEKADMLFVEAENKRTKERKSAFGMPDLGGESSSNNTPAGIARRESERQAAKSDTDTPGLRLLDSSIRAARGDELDTSDASFGTDEVEELNDLFK